MVASDPEAWLATLDAETQVSVAARPSATIRPTRMSLSGRSEALVAALAASKPTIELRVGKVIGEGGMGLVREAVQVALDRTVAIKTMKDHATDPVVVRDLLREAWVTGSLEHPNVVPVHHLELDSQQRPVLVLKRVDGVAWSTLLADPEALAARVGQADPLVWNLGILDRVLDALRFAHSRGVIHRDVKPSNIMIGHFGEVYLLDWGLAVALEDDGTGRFPLARDATAMAGTPHYMAPEMLGRGIGTLSTRTDVYLAGAVLYELVTGRPPHRGANPLAIYASIAVSEPELGPSVPAELAHILAKALAAEQEERYDSIATLQIALARYLEHRGSERVADGARTQLAALVERAATPDASRREELYRELAICRHAFRQALALWPENEAARADLARATTAVAAYELACKDPRAAVALLTELTEPSPLLAEAKAAAAAQAELERIGLDQDPRLGTVTRAMALFFGAIFSVAPLASELLGMGTSFRLQIVWPVVMGAIVLAVGGTLRGRRFTAINRRVFHVGVFLFGSQTLLTVVAWRLGLTAETAQVTNLFLWGVLAGMFAITTERSLGWASAAYFVAFAIAGEIPDHRMYCMSASNFVFFMVVATRWRVLR